MKKIHKTFIATAAVATVVAPAAASAATDFKDVKSTDYYAEAIQSLVERGIIKGYTEDQTFRPGKDVTRGQAAKMIAGILGYDTVNVKDPKFKDVPITNEYYGAIAALAERGIINGNRETGTFNPHEPMTRHQMAKVISLAFELEADTTDLPFTDVLKEYESYVAALVGNKITTGKTATIFDGKSNVTRGQIVALIHRAELSKAETKLTEISGKVSAVTDQTITIDGVEYKVASQLQNILHAKNAAALQDAIIKATIENNVINAVETLTITQKGTKAKPVVLQGVIKPTASVMPIAASLPGIQQLVLQAQYVEVRNIEVPQLVISSATQLVTLLGTFNNVKVDEGAKVTVQGDATIQQLVVASGEETVIEVTGEIAKVDVTTDKSAIKLGEKTVVKAIDTKGKELATIIKNYDEVKNNIIAETQDAGNGSTPGGSSTVTSDSTPGGSSTVTPDSTPGGSSTVTPDSTTGGSSTVTPGSTTGGSSTVTPDSTPGGSSTVTPDSTTGGSSTVTPDGTTDTEKKAEEVISNLEQVKIIPVEDKFGYVTLSVLNSDDLTIKYRFVNHYEQELPAIGSKAPADSIEYKKGDQFIAWYSKDLQVFAVNDKDEIIDIYKTQNFETFTHPQNEMKVEENKIIFKSIYAPLMRFDKAYYVHNNQFYMFEEQYTSKIDESGIPVFELALPSNFTFDAQKMVTFTYHLSTLDKNGEVNGGFLSWYDFGPYDAEQQEANNLLALKNILQKDLIKSEVGKTWIENILRQCAYTVEEVKDANGEVVSKTRNPKALPFLLEQYVESLKDSELNTRDELVKIVDDVNEANKELIGLFYKAEAAVELVYKEDYYEYDYYDQLKDSTTRADIQAAEKLLQELQTKLPINDDISYMKSLVESAYKIFERYEELQSIQTMFSSYNHEENGRQFAEVLNRFALYDTAIEPLMEQYAAQLAKVTKLTPATLKATILEVNNADDNEEVLKKYNKAKVAFDALFKANRYSYDQYESLAEGVTKENVEAAEKLVTELGLTGLLDNLYGGLSQARYIVETLEYVGNLNETAKTYLAGDESTQANMHDSLKNHIQNIVTDDYKEILFDQYVEVISKVTTISVTSLKQIVKNINADVVNEQILNSYDVAKAAVDALLKENYGLIDNIDERLNNGVTEQQIKDAKALVDALQVEEKLKKSLVSKLQEASRGFEAKAKVASLQQKAKDQLATETTDQYYWDIKDILDDTMHGRLSNEQWGYLHYDVLLEQYIKEFAINSYTTVAQVKAAVQAVNEKNVSTVQLVEEVRKLNQTNSLPAGTTIEYLNDLQLKVEQLDSFFKDSLLSHISSAKSKFYEDAKRPEKLQSISNWNALDENSFIHLTFTEAVDTKGITIELAGLEQGVDYEVVVLENDYINIKELNINIKKLKPVAFSTISVKGVTLTNTEEVVELSNIPVLYWFK